MSAPPRTLPLRVPIVPGEALDSWLEALAHRHQVTVGTLTAALGWPVPASSGGLVAGIPAQVLRRLEHQTGLPTGRLDSAVLERYLPLGPVRRRGSRYCPSCLAERDGRWLLSWRLGWTFACTIHGVLLCDTCPACGQEPRSRTSRTSGLNPPSTCANTIKRHEHCGADLRQATAQQLTSESPALAAQDWITTLTAGMQAKAGATTQNALTDLGIVASWVLRRAPAGQFAESGPQALAAWHEWNQPPPAARRQPSRFPPASAALTAALAATAMTVLTGSDEQAIEQIRALLPPAAGPRRPRPAGLPAPRWRQLSERTRGRFLRALDPDLSPADRIRYRTGTPQAAIPASPPGLLAARARAIPQLLWPDWAIRLMPARGFAPGAFRSAMDHPEFGGDSILPRCSCLGGRCLPRYRRLTEPRSDHFPLLLYRTSVHQAAPGGLGISSSGTPHCTAGSPGWSRVTRSGIACDAGGALDLGGGSAAPVPRPARRCPAAGGPAVTSGGISEEGRGPGRSPGGCGRSPPG